MRYLAMTGTDIRFQFRHGFYVAYLFVAVIYIVLLRSVPEGARPPLVVALVFTDASVLGFFFVGGMVLLERGQNILASLFVTPLRVGEYIVAKLFSLTILSVIVSSAVIFAGYGIPPNPLLLFTGVITGSIVAVLLGLLLSTRVQQLNGYFGLSLLYTPFFVIPILDILGIWRTPLSYLMPPYGSLLLISYGFNEPELWNLVYAIVFQALAAVALFALTRAWFIRYVITQTGDEQ